MTGVQLSLEAKTASGSPGESVDHRKIAVMPRLPWHPLVDGIGSLDHMGITSPAPLRLSPPCEMLNDKFICLLISRPWGPD